MSSCVAGPSVAVDRGGAISATPGLRAAPRLMIKNDRLTHRRLDNFGQKVDKISRQRGHTRMWLSGAGIPRRPLLQDDIGLSVACQYRFRKLGLLTDRFPFDLVVRLCLGKRPLRIAGSKIRREHMFFELPQKPVVFRDWWFPALIETAFWRSLSVHASSYAPSH